MKIEFDISKNDVILLLNSLRFALKSAPNPQQQQRLQKIIDEVITDAKINDEIYRQLKFFLDDAKGVPASKVIAETKLKAILPTNYINLGGGLESVCNNILVNLKNVFKPQAPFARIPLYKVKKCNTIKEIVELIIEYYEDL